VETCPACPRAVGRVKQDVFTQPRSCQGEQEGKAGLAWQRIAGLARRINLICGLLGKDVVKAIMMAYNERAAKDAFDAAHGERVQFNDSYYFEDGAARTIDAISEMRPPPEGEFERLQMILFFHRAKLTRAVRDFDAFKEDLSHRACGNGEEISRLKELQGIVGKCSKAVERAQAALDDTAIGRARKGAAEARQQEAVRKSAWLGKINEVRI